MSNYPESIDVYVDKTGSDYVGSSDPNVAYAGIETSQGLVGALGKPQSWSTTLMTLLRRYRSGLNLTLSGSNVVVTSGEAVLENTSSTKWVFRRNPDDVTVGAGNLDVGTLVATVYYVFATGASATTTAPIMYSTDFNSPSGMGTAPYHLIGWFKNEAIGSLAVTYIGDYNESQSAGQLFYVEATTAWTYYGGVSGTGWHDVLDLSLSLVSDGGKYIVSFAVPCDQYGYGLMEVTEGGSQIGGGALSYPYSAAPLIPLCPTMQFPYEFSAGFHTIQARIHMFSGAHVFSYNSSYGKRWISVQKV